jgi:hypothetical protein
MNCWVFHFVEIFPDSVEIFPTECYKLMKRGYVLKFLEKKLDYTIIMKDTVFEMKFGIVLSIWFRSHGLIIE